MEELLVFHALAPEPCGGSRTVEDLPGKIAEGRVHLRPKHFVILVPEGVMEIAGGNPPGDIMGFFTPRPSPLPQ